MTELIDAQKRVAELVGGIRGQSSQKYWIRQIADVIREAETAARNEALERSAQIAESIDSGRGNEAEIARAIRELIQ